jgi:thioredoxin-like negative regulator of GroEL
VNAQDKRAQRLQLLDDHIGQHLRQSAAQGELKTAPSYGKPLDFGDGYEQTPSELRMGMKVLKDAGVVPPEVEAMQRAAQLKSDIEACTDLAEKRVLQQRLSDMQQAIALRLEGLRASGRW